MKVVVDTNVFLSGVFFAGHPYAILNAWRHDRIELILSAEILAEYQETAERLSKTYPDIDFTTWIELVVLRASLVVAPALPNQVCTDPDDDKFLACALAGGATVVASGDRALLRVSGYLDIEVLSPAVFVAKYLA
jgi:putative PIN family toxin of toxin-antitoxin system